MTRVRRVVSITTVLVLLSAAAAAPGAEEAADAYRKEGPGSRPVPTDMRLPEADPGAKPKPADWYAPLKDIPLGPGTLDIDLQFRTRYEHYDGYNFPRYNGDENDDLLMLRTWLGFDYKFTEEAHAYVMFQDSRSYLSSLRRDTYAVTSPFFDQADVRRAYVEWKHIGGSPLGFKIGRQAWAYGGRRLLGPSNWGNVGGFWWDAAKVYIDTEPVQVDLFFGQR
ncbi:MAG: alginate export family protein, partial [Phycisphaerae bacterium]